MAATASLEDWDLILETDTVRDWTPLVIQQNVQIFAPLRGQNAKQVPRGGALVGYQFTVTRQHASYNDAGLYLDGLPSLVVQTFGDFTANRGLGGADIELTDARVSAINAQPHRGILTVVTFTVVGSLPPAA